MKKQKILISIDHKWRDLPGYVYLGHQLEKKGYKVFFFRNGLERFAISGIRPNIVVINHLHYKFKQEFAKKLKQMGIHVVILPTEGIPTLKETVRWHAGERFDLSGLSLQLSWTDEFKKILKSNKTISPNIIKTIGCPRFDFYKDPLKSFLSDKKSLLSKYQITNNKFPIVTIATNFTLAQFHNKNQTLYKKITSNWDGIQTTDKSRNENAINSFESRAITLENIKKLLIDYPNVNFILKTHPSEDQNFYKGFYDEMSSEFKQRFALINNEYIWDVLNISDIEISRSCTTAVESWIIGIPTIEMQFHTKRLYYSDEHASGSDIVSTYDELCQTLNYYLNGGRISEDKLKNRKIFLNKWCYKLDGNSTNRAVDELLKLKKQRTFIKFNFFHFLVYWLLKITDYKIHDIKIYGWRQFFSPIKTDLEGRIDKNYHDKDIFFWRKKFRGFE